MYIESIFPQVIASKSSLVEQLMSEIEKQEINGGT